MAAHVCWTILLNFCEMGEYIYVSEPYTNTILLIISFCYALVEHQVILLLPPNDYILVLIRSVALTIPQHHHQQISRYFDISCSIVKQRPNNFYLRPVRGSNIPLLHLVCWREETEKQRANISIEDASNTFTR